MEFQDAFFDELEKIGSKWHAVLRGLRSSPRGAEMLEQLGARQAIRSNPGAFQEAVMRLGGKGVKLPEEAGVIGTIGRQMHAPVDPLALKVPKKLQKPKAPKARGRVAPFAPGMPAYPPLPAGVPPMAPVSYHTPAMTL